MAVDELKVEGLKELLDALDTIDKNSEKKIRKHLNKQGREFINSAKEITPEKTGKLKKSYVSMQVDKNFGEFIKPIRNKAPHHHLVNNGHRQVTSNGKEIGFVQGRHYIEETIAKKTDDFNKETEDFIDELFKELIE